MTKKLSAFLGIGLLIITILPACQNAVIEPTFDSQGWVATSVALTLQAYSSNPTTTPSPTSQSPTATLRPTGTPISTLMQLPTFQPPVPAQGSCYLMTVTDITIPDDTEFEPGSHFTKTWRLYNKGSCTWSKSFVVFFFSGDQMGPVSSKALPVDVPTGTTIDISFNMVAPSTDGTYKSNWKMKASDGTVFGSGASGVPFFVQIKVKTIPFAVNGVAISVDNAGPISNLCTEGHTFTFTAAISVTTAGTVTYYWTRSDGGTSTPASIDFTGAGTQNATLTWTLTGDIGSSTVSVYIDTPNHQLFGPGGTFTYDCNP
jgi:hypothetical protein